MLYIAKSDYLDTMKRLLVLCLLPFAVAAQNWTPFPLDETSEWRERLDFLGPDPSGGCFDNYYRIYQVVDTVQQQNGNQYFDLGFTERFWETWVLQPCSTGYQWPGVLFSGSAGLFRAENGKLLMLDGTNEVVFFDFTSAVGDTVNDSFHGTYVVDSVDQVIIGNNSCRRIWTQSHGDPVWIIENIGHARGLFGWIHFFENVGSLCYLENQVPLASGGSYYNACLAVDISSPESASVKLFPNLTSGTFQIEVGEPSEYEIYNLLGIKVLEGKLNRSGEIDLGDQPNGIYLVTVQSQNGLSTAKVVKQ